MGLTERVSGPVISTKRSSFYTNHILFKRKLLQICSKMWRLIYFYFFSVLVGLLFYTNAWLFFSDILLLGNSLELVCV